MSADDWYRAAIEQSLNGVALHEVVYMSGYAEPAGIEDISALEGPFLRKPFAPDELVRVVRDCLQD